ncbi:hypothetical protein [Carp edema virus]|nr:hypothetical protein [Carp edema virus]
MLDTIRSLCGCGVKSDSEIEAYTRNEFEVLMTEPRFPKIKMETTATGFSNPCFYEGDSSDSTEYESSDSDDEVECNSQSPSILS